MADQHNEHVARQTYAVFVRGDIASGKQFTYEEAQVATYRDGQMARFQTYGDTAALVTAHRGE